MDFDRSKHNVIKYLPTNNDENIWGMSISGIGFQSIDPKAVIPLKVTLSDIHLIPTEAESLMSSHLYIL